MQLGMSMQQYVCTYVRSVQSLCNKCAGCESETFAFYKSMQIKLCFDQYYICKIFNVHKFKPMLHRFINLHCFRQQISNVYIIFSPRWVHLSKVKRHRKLFILKLSYTVLRLKGQFVMELCLNECSHEPIFSIVLCYIKHDTLQCHTESRCLCIFRLSNRLDLTKCVSSQIHINLVQLQLQ